MAKRTSHLSELSLPVWCKPCLIRAFHLQASSSIMKFDANLKWKHFKCLTRVLFSSQSILVGSRSPPEHLCCFFLQIKQKVVRCYQDWKSKPPESFPASSSTSEAPDQGYKEIQKMHSITGWSHQLRNEAVWSTTHSLQWGAPTQLQEQCTGLSWGARTQRSSCVNAVWLFLPAQKCHLVSHSRQLFNPLDAFLPFNKCHCTGSSISVSFRQEDQYGQMP